MPTDHRRISWTDFNKPGRVHILAVHNSESAGVNAVKRFRKTYPNLKLVAYPEGEVVKSGDDLSGALAEQVRNSEVIFE
jgi:hypothetical protein